MVWGMGLRSFTIRGLIRAIIETFPALRWVLTIREVKRETLRVRSAAAAAGVSVFSPGKLETALRSKPEASVFFILGSGSSVNKLSQEQFSMIGRHRSVGINYWAAHPFIPDFYALESIPFVGDGNDFDRCLRLISTPKKLRVESPVLVLRTRNSAARRALSRFRAASSATVFFYGRVTPLTAKLKNLLRDIPRLHKVLDRHAGELVIDSGATVVRMIGVARQMGFRNIVLVGVELYNTRYFWEDKNFDPPTDVVPVNNQSATTHESNSPKNRRFRAQDMILALQESLQREGVTLSLAFKTGVLSGRLPTYAWGVDAPLGIWRVSPDLGQTRVSAGRLKRLASIADCLRG